MPRGHYIPLTKTQELKIKKEYLIKPIKTLAEELGITYGRVMRLLKKWGLEIPPEIVKSRRRSGRFEKGQVSKNKGKKQHEYMSPAAIERTKATRFKKGDLPHNTKFDGHERISKDGYVEVRLSLGKYVLKHLYRWEEINGKIPKGHCLWCVGGDKTNCDPGNWKLITRAESMLNNSIHNYPKEVIPSMVLTGKIAKKIEKIEDATK